MVVPSQSTKVLSTKDIDPAILLRKGVNLPMLSLAKYFWVAISLSFLPLRLVLALMGPQRFPSYLIFVHLRNFHLYK